MSSKEERPPHQKVTDSLTTQHREKELLRTMTTHHLEQKMGDLKQQNSDGNAGATSGGTGSQDPGPAQQSGTGEKK